MIITKSKFIITIGFALLFCIIFTNVGTCEETDGNILHVDDDGTTDYISIQDAIDEASDGDTIFVNKGIYTGPIVIIKQIKLIGLEKPIINEYMEVGNTINISADNVTLDGFILQNNNINNTKGVYITSNNNIITNCSIKNYFRGIFLHNSHNNIIQDNIVENNKLDGIDLIESNFNKIQRNIVINNINYGINLWNANQNIINENILSKNNESGLFLHSSNNNTITENIIENNTLYGIASFQKSNNNFFYYNNFINNSIQAEDEDNNTWYNIISKEGNYWSDYTSLNANATGENGIWSQPYNISENGLIQDLYPLVEKYEIQKPANKENTNLLDENDDKDNISIFLIFILVIVCVILIFIFWKKKEKK